jgi:hypothetical protein
MRANIDDIRVADQDGFEGLLEQERRPDASLRTIV